MSSNSQIIISVDMEYSGAGGNSVVLKKVADAEGKDITGTYDIFCKKNGFDVTKKADIESAAIPFIEQYAALLP